MQRDDAEALLDSLRARGVPEEDIQKLRTLAARMLGQRGGQSRSPAKAEAARVNGAKGGRPRKVQP